MAKFMVWEQYTALSDKQMSNSMSNQLSTKFDSLAAKRRELLRVPFKKIIEAIKMARLSLVCLYT